MNENCVNITHIELDTLKLMIDEGFGVKSQVNPVAAGGGSGPTTYNDFDESSFWAMDDWSSGALQKTHESPGYQYGTLDSRFDSELLLPPKVTTVTEFSGQAHFVNRGRDTYMAIGRTLNMWNATTDMWEQVVADTGVEATDLEWFDGYLHIGGVTGMGYRWYRLSDGVMGNGPTGYVPTPPSTEFPWGVFNDATMFYAYNGFIYAVQNNEIWYTSGQASFITGPDPTATPDQWEWVGPIVVGATDEPITGLAGVQFQSTSTQQVLVSTPTQLFTLLPGDVILAITEWESYVDTTGVNALAYNGDAYFPVGDSLYRVTNSGQIVNMGTNLGSGLPCSLTGRHIDLERMRNYLLALVDGDTPSVWAWSGGGWHPIAQLDSIGEANHLHYSQLENILWVAGDSGIAQIKLPDTGVNPLKSATTFEQEGFIDFPVFRANLWEITKDFHSVSLHGRNFAAGEISVWWRLDDPGYLDDCSLDPESYDGWTLLGTTSTEDTEFNWPCNGTGRATGKALWLRVQMKGNSMDKTPVLDAVRTKYVAVIKDIAAWNYRVALPWECLVDMCGAPVQGYDQRTYDCGIDSMWRGEQPSRFLDIDGSEYYVRIINAVRRVFNVRLCNGERVFDVEWSLNLLEQSGCSTTICDTV